uniref:Probable magnesium transporter n=1 Tax=Lactuca sativa TaxID=4236 RepID=A0A9R1W967_LACSA|nr:hypothetical protein LSAT_V11C200066570 [Lactuca sativa]
MDFDNRRGSKFCCLCICSSNSRNPIRSFKYDYKVMCVKAVGIAMKLSFSGSNQFIYFQTWIFTLLLFVFCLTQLNYLNKALDTFNTAVISPVYYVMFTSLTILASMIMFKNWNHQNATQIVTELSGFVTIFSGTFLLHKTKDMGTPVVVESPKLSHSVTRSTNESPRRPELNNLLLNFGVNDVSIEA